jgi:hypothetical protein
MLSMLRLHAAGWPRHPEARTGEAARETKLAELRALKVPELKQLCDQQDVAQDRQEEGARSAAVRRAEQQKKPAEKKNFSKAEVLKMLDLPEMQNLLRQKRLRWVGHALRRKDVVALDREANNRESIRKLTSAYTQI